MSSSIQSGGLTVPVSVVIPAYERASMIERAVKSALAQQPAPERVIVVDDGSADETSATAAAAGAEVIRHERNRGVSAARNTGIEAVEHDWIALLDSDDEWLPGHLARLWGKRGDHVLLADAMLAINERRNRWYGYCGKADIEVTDPSQILFPENYLPTSAVLMRRDTAISVGCFEEGMTQAEDLDFLVRMIEAGPALAIPVIGAIYHLHPGQASADKAEMGSAHAFVIDRFGDRPWFRTAVVRYWEGVTGWDRARAALWDGERWAAVAAMAKVAVSPRRTRGLAELLLWRRRGRQLLSERPAS
jgi:glycosyltransferase involved in cell wall biosynthesis